MKQRLLFLVVCGWLAAPAFAAQSSTNAPTPGKRFLFIVDTSSSMKRLADSTRNFFFDLIFTGLDGQMRPGDSFGLWAFDEATFTDFPMQAWNPVTSFGSAITAAVFLSEQRYDKRPNAEQVLRKASVVIRSVGDVTVLMLSDGSYPVQGTPFDSEIKQAFDHELRGPRRPPLPFVTVLVARNGTIEGWRVNAPGQVIELPQLPPPLKVSETVRPETSAPPQQASVAEKTAPPAPRAKSIAAPATTTNATFSPVIAETPKVVKEIKTVSKPPAEQASLEKTSPVTKAETNTTPAPTISSAVTNRPTQVVDVKPAPAAAPAKSEDPKALQAVPITSETVKTIDGAKQTKAIPPPITAQTETAVPTQQPAVSVAKTEVKASASPPIASSSPQKNLQPNPPPAAELNTASSKPAVAAKVPAAKKPELPPRAVSDTGPVKPPIIKAESVNTNAAKPNLAVVTPENQFSTTTLLIAGLALLFVACLLGWLLLRRTRGAPQPSLISESMDQRGK